MRKVLALAVALVLLAALTGYSKGGGDNKAEWNPNPSVKVEGGTTAAPGTAGSGTTAPLGDNSSALEVCEALADTFMAMADAGKALEENGAQLAAYSEYLRALAAVSAMQLCADELFAAKGDAAPSDGRIADWDEIGGLNFAEWSVWIFEGLALQAKGDTDAAKERYTNAAVYPDFSEEYADALILIYALDAGELKTLRAGLAAREDKIYEVWTPATIQFPRDQYCFDGKYLIASATAIDRESGEVNICREII
jgi:hypothetical protein